MARHLPNIASCNLAVIVALSKAIVVRIMVCNGCGPGRKMLFDSEIKFHARAHSRRVFLRIRRDPNNRTWPSSNDCFWRKAAVGGQFRSASWGQSGVRREDRQGVDGASPSRLPSPTTATCVPRFTVISAVAGRRTMISTAMTMKLYGRRSASLTMPTITVSLSESRLARDGMANGARKT
jgi:hypothetical protein